MTLVGVFG